MVVRAFRNSIKAESLIAFTALIPAGNHLAMDWDWPW